MPLTFADLTSNLSTDDKFVVTGDGVFDDLMEAANTHLDAQYKLGRLTGTDYATVYLGALQATVQQSVAYLLGQETTNSQVALNTLQGTKFTAEIALLDAQSTAVSDKSVAEVNLLSQKEITEWAQTRQSTKVAPAAGSILDSQGNLFIQQAKGFKWNADQKYLKTIMDAWSINTSTAGVADTTITALIGAGVDGLNNKIADATPVD